MGALLSLLSLLIALASGLSAQALPAYRHRILGVFDTEGKPLAGVEVIDVSSGTFALTTTTGTVSLAYLPDGGSEVRIRQLGYEPVNRFVRIGPADTTPVTVILISTTTTLPTVVTRDTSSHPMSPGLRDFEARRREGNGHFITDAQLRKSDNREMANVIRTIPGIVVSCAKVFPYDCHAASGRALSKYAIVGGGPCLFMVYVDGVRSSETDLNRYRVPDYAAIEAYTGSQIPQQYNATGAACGVVLFWSR